MRWLLHGVKYVVRAVLGEHELYRVFRAPSPPLAVQDGDDVVEVCDLRLVEASPDPALADLAGYAKEQAIGFVLLELGEPVCGCWYVYGDRYREIRDFLPLREGEASLVEIVTVPAHRGRRLAPRLIAATTARMYSRGFRALYARVWHSNTASRSAFRRAGWNEVAWAVALPSLAVKWFIPRRRRSAQPPEPPSRPPSPLSRRRAA